MVRSKSIILERKGENDGFAQRFGNAIPDGSLVFIEGEEGTGKSVLSMRFCKSILQNGHTASYVSTQFTIKSFLRQAASIGYDVRKYLMTGKLFFISTEVMLAETLPKSTFLDGLLTCKKLFDPDVIFIDSISTLLNKSLNIDNLVDLTNFFNRLTGSGKIIMMSGNPNEWPADVHNSLKMISDVHFKITRETAPGIGIVHNIYLEKFNGATQRYEPLTTFSVKPNTGLAIETSGVAF